ncbi:substance-P receptor-like [Stylophora pistillata]|uniref:substance-P receptor-like n=1 Tax=Stylophora pistillata TaxID=50429 RepID=UPI000C043F89|nr:substance-P receptor-like [Stylophora pistillata]
MRPILSATGTYKYALAKWLDDKLKPLSSNRYTISDTFSFADEIQNLVIDENDILVSYDVTSLFTNVPLQETIEIIAEKTFADNWFNATHDLSITKPKLVQLLEVATMNQLFQFDGNLYEQIDGVAMGSPLGPLMANAFLCSIEEKLDQDHKLPEFYRSSPAGESKFYIYSALSFIIWVSYFDPQKLEDVQLTQFDKGEMNNSNVTDEGRLPDCPPWDTSSAALQWIKTIVYLFILFLALFGNTSVIWIIFRHRRMRTATNYLIANMAVGDLLMAMITMIPHAVNMFRGSHDWVSDSLFGQISCKLFLFTQGSSMACSIFTLTALALERFFAVVFPIWKVVNIKRTRWLVGFIWMGSIASASPLFYAAKVIIYAGVPFCLEEWAPAFDGKRSQSIFTIVSFVLLYVLPLLLISVLYSIIIAKVWGRNIPGNVTPANQRLLNRSKRNVLKMLISVVVAFALCWCLMHLNLILMDFTDIFLPCGIPIGLQTTGFLFGHANSAINCCIYLIFSQDFRRGMKDILKPLLPNRAATLLVDNTRAGSSLDATVELKTSYRQGRPQARSFKIIQV